MQQRSKLAVRSIPGAYSLTIEATRPDMRRRDLGNLEKPISDFLQSMGIIEDDCLAQRITLEWGVGLPAAIVVTVKSEGAAS